MRRDSSTSSYAESTKGRPAELLRDWLLSPEGQKVVEESGYIPIKPIAASSKAVQEISAANVSQNLGDNRWKWTVFLKGDKKELERIDYVEYTLHPTFPDPVRRVRTLGDPDRAFALSSKGWGTFEINIRVVMKDGTQKRLKHQLKF